VQDALSFRVAPQVHGALREQVAYLRRAVEVELAGMGDNPLVSVADRSVVHNGNFHPLVLGLACDVLRVAIAHVGQLSDRRMSHLWQAFFAGLGRMADLPPADALPPLPGVASRYPAARLVAELRQQAEPATLDAPPLDLGVEDHATSAPLSVRRTEQALDALDGLEDILAAELLLARDVLAGREPAPRLGAGTAAALRVAGECAAAAEPWPDAVHAALRTRFAEL
jgi:histidine ammonia-lyase